MPSTPALLEMTVRFLTPDSRIASDKTSGMPQSPKPPDMINMPSFKTPASADLASGYTLFMRVEPRIECCGEMQRRDGGRAATLVSTVAILLALLGETANMRQSAIVPPSANQLALKASRKTS